MSKLSKGTLTGKEAPPQAGYDASIVRTLTSVINLTPHPPEQYVLDGKEELRKAFEYLKQIPGIDLQQAPPDPTVDEVLQTFLASRKAPREGYRGTRDGFYAVYLPKALPVLGLRLTPFAVDSFIQSLARPDRKPRPDREPKPCSPGGQKAYFVAVRTFFNWLYSKRSPYPAFKPQDNPFHRDNGLKPPDVPDRKLARQTEESVLTLMSEAGKGEHPLRDQALLAIYFESGGRLREGAGITEPDIIWEKRQFKAVIKGGDEKVYEIGRAHV